MLLIYLVSFLLAVAVALIGRRWRRWVRVTVALLVFILPSVGATLLMAKVGDRAAPGGITIPEAPGGR